MRKIGSEGKKIPDLFCLETLKNVILHEKLYLEMTTIMVFFLQIRAVLSNFRKRAGETSHPTPPSSYKPQNQ